MSVFAPSKILVIGTSNSIVRGGWYDGFKQTIGSEVHRIALGGAAFSQFLAQAEALGVGEYELIVVETSPNDETYSDSIGDRWVFEALYDAFICILRKKSAVIVLRIPPSGNLNKLSDVSLLQRNVCLKYGALYLDTSPILTDICETSGREIYRDKYHPNTDVSAELGRRIALDLVVQKAAAQKSSSPDGTRYFSEKLPTLNLEELKVHTEIIQETFAVLPQDKSYKLPKPMQCFGLFVATERTNCVLRLNGIGASRDVFCFFKGQKNLGTVQFLAIRNGFFLSSIEIVRPWRSAEFALHSVTYAPPYELAVSSLLCFE